MSDAEAKKCPMCGGEMESVDDLPKLARAVPFPLNKTVEGVWEGVRLRVRILECGGCGLLLAFRRENGEG